MTVISTDSKQNMQLIVQTAVRCFIRDGVPETSIEDIIGESGLSPDVVYGLFSHKYDIIRMLGGANKAAAGGVLKQLLQETPLAAVDEMLGRSAEFFDKGAQNRGPMSLVPQVFGIAIYDDEVNVIMRDVLGELQNLWIELAKRMADEGRLPAGADPQDVGRTLGCIIVGYLVQSLLSDVKPGHVRRGLQALAR
jgi:TetR/AcrR family transcriptional regulator, transcriptional repressor of aconitase